MSVSGHKICAPKGSGALYIRRGVHVPPLIFGGGQERGMRAGTENLPAIAALGAACAVLDGRVREHFERACALRGRLLELLAQIEGVRVLSPPDARRTSHACPCRDTGPRQCCTFLKAGASLSRAGRRAQRGRPARCWLRWGCPRP